MLPWLFLAIFLVGIGAYIWKNITKFTTTGRLSLDVERTTLRQARSEPRLHSTFIHDMGVAREQLRRVRSDPVTQFSFHHHEEEIMQASPSLSTSTFVSISDSLSSIQTPTPPQLSTRLTKKSNDTILCSLITSIGGFIISYLVAVRGGVLDMNMVIKKLSHHLLRKKIHAKVNNYCQFVDIKVQLLLGSSHLLAIVGILVVSKTANSWGRRPTLTMASLMMLVGVSLTTWFPNATTFICGCIIQDLGIGMAQLVFDLIKMEIAPKTCQMLFDMSQLLGAVVACYLNYLTFEYIQTGWRISLGTIGFLVLPLVILSFLITETPTYLLEKGKEEEARSTLQNLRGTEEIEEELGEIKAILQESRDLQFKSLLNPNYYPPLMISVLTCMLSLFSVVQALSYYSPLMVNSMGLTLKMAYMIPLMISLSDLVTSVISILVRAVLGIRRKILILSAAALVVSQIGLALYFYMSMHQFDYLEIPYPLVILGCINVGAQGFLAAPKSWLEVSFPKTTKVIETTTMKLIKSVVGAFLVMTSPLYFCQLGKFLFFLYVVLDIFILFFIIGFVPETTKITADEIVRKVWSKHWFWKKYVKPNINYG